MVADRFDVVAVEIENVRRVVVRVVLRTETRTAVVDSTGRDRGVVEVIDRGTIAAFERHVCPADGPPLADPEVEPVHVREVCEPTRLLVDDAVSERFQCADVEVLGGFEIGHVDGDVCEHPLSFPGYSRRA